MPKAYLAGLDQELRKGVFKPDHNLVIHQYLKKGSLAFVEGKIKTRSWEGKDGAKKYATEIIASSVQFLDTKGEDNGN